MGGRMTSTRAPAQAWTMGDWRPHFSIAAGALSPGRPRGEWKAARAADTSRHRRAASSGRRRRARPPNDDRRPLKAATPRGEGHDLERAPGARIAAGRTGSGPPLSRPGQRRRRVAPRRDDDAWWTGPILASSASTLPKGRALIEPYLYDAKPYGVIDGEGKRPRRPGLRHLRLADPYLLYGVTDTFTAGVIPRFGYARTGGRLQLGRPAGRLHRPGPVPPDPVEGGRPHSDHLGDAAGDPADRALRPAGRPVPRRLRQRALRHHPGDQFPDLFLDAERPHPAHPPARRLHPLGPRRRRRDQRLMARRPVSTAGPGRATRSSSTWPSSTASPADGWRRSTWPTSATRRPQIGGIDKEPARPTSAARRSARP